MVEMYDNNWFLIKVSELKGRLTDYESGSVAVSGPPKEPAAQQGEMDR